MSSLFEKSLFSGLGTMQGAMYAAAFALVILACMIVSYLTHLSILQIFKRFVVFLMKIFGKTINKSEKKYHRDLEIGRKNEKSKTVKLYRFMSELIIDLAIQDSGVTPFEFITLITILVFIIVTIICKILFGHFTMTILFSPIALVATVCILYSKANVNHDKRIENVIEAENIICNNIKGGVTVSIKESMNVLPKELRPYFREYVDNIEQQNYHVKTALLKLNLQLGSIADDFIKNCIVFELEEEHGIANMFQDIVEINNIRMDLRTIMKRKFEEVKHDFIISLAMIFLFLGGVLAIYDNVREFYFTTAIGQIILGIDALLIIIEFVYITYLRAKEL